jgi:NAD-dependent SIR2 family protein deacetylase
MVEPILHGTFAKQTTHSTCPKCGNGFTVPDMGACILDEQKRPVCPKCTGERGRKLIAKMDFAQQDDATCTMLLHPHRQNQNRRSTS